MSLNHCINSNAYQSLYSAGLATSLFSEPCNSIPEHPFVASAGYYSQCTKQKLNVAIPRRAFKSGKSSLKTRYMKTSASSHPCPFLSCDRLFSTKYNAKAHLRVHTGEKPFVCSLGCEERFKWASSRNNHQQKKCPLRGDLKKCKVTLQKSEDLASSCGSLSQPSNFNHHSDLFPFQNTNITNRTSRFNDKEQVGQLSKYLQVVNTSGTFSVDEEERLLTSSWTEWSLEDRSETSNSKYWDNTGICELVCNSTDQNCSDQ